MAVTFEMEVEVKSPPDAFWNTVKDINFLYPKLFPDMYDSIVILEGDGRSAGTVRRVNYAKGFAGGGSYMSKIVSLDEENKSVTYTVLDGDLLRFYKFLDDTIAVRADGNGTVAYWSYTYEKAINEAPDGETMRDALVGIMRKLDAHTMDNL